LVAIGALVAAASAGLVTTRWTDAALLAFVIASLGFVLRRGEWHLPTGAKFREGMLSVEDGCVTLDGNVICQLTELEQGLVLTSRGATLVRLDRHGSRAPLWLRVVDVEAADELLRATSLDAAHSAVSIRIDSGYTLMSGRTQLALVALPLCAIGLALVATLWAPSIAGPYLFALVMLWITLVLVLTSAPCTVRVGTDGLVMSWLGRERFVPYRAVREVKTDWKLRGANDRDGVTVVLTDGDTVPLPTGSASSGLSGALARRIDAARTAHALEHPTHPVAALARGARTPGQWVTALRQVGSGATAGARTAAVPLDVLLTLIEDGAAPAIERVSAAVAALPYADDETRRRIRLAADSSASPKLRVALDRVEREQADEAAIAETLVELEDDAATAAVRGRCASD
jgi:hypothetical protein